jgi:hypothetical protein
MNMRTNGKFDFFAFRQQGLLIMLNKVLIANRAIVIASEAKLSSTRPGSLDCRVAALLAMTA